MCSRHLSREAGQRRKLRTCPTPATCTCDDRDKAIDRAGATQCHRHRIFLRADARSSLWERCAMRSTQNRRASINANSIHISPVIPLCQTATGRQFARGAPCKVESRENKDMHDVFRRHMQICRNAQCRPAHAGSWKLARPTGRFPRSTRISPARIRRCRTSSLRGRGPIASRRRTARLRW